MRRRSSSVLSPEHVSAIVEGYREGAFLMANDSGRLGWYQSKEHALFPLDRPMPYPKSLGRSLRSGRWTYRINTAFSDCVAGCADRQETWISLELRVIYGALHEAGVAHSFEAWQGDTLAGGLIGLSIGAAFIGESMFFRMPDASKCALVLLHAHLRDCGFRLFDAQLMNPHLARFGAQPCPREEYLRLLDDAVNATPRVPFATEPLS